MAMPAVDWHILSQQHGRPIKASPLNGDFHVLEIGAQRLLIDLDAEAGPIRSRDFAGPVRREMVLSDIQSQLLGSEGILAEAMAFEPGIGLNRGAEREVPG